MKNVGFKGVAVNTVKLKSGVTSPEHLETGVFRKHPLGRAVSDKDPSAFEGVAQQLRQGIIERWGDRDISFALSALMTVGVK
jgi:hypothetical protein